MSKNKRKRYSKWSNISLSLKEIWKYDKKLIFYQVVNITLEALKPFPTVILAGKIVDEIVKKNEYSVILMYIGLMFGMNYMLSFLESILKQVMDYNYANFRNHLDREVSNNCMRIDFEGFNDSAFQDRVLFTNNMAQGKNYLTALLEVSDIVSHFITLLGMTLIISFLDVRMLLISLCTMLMQAGLHLFQLRINREYQSNSIDERKKMNYALGLAKNINVKKDIQVFNLQPLIFDKIIASQNSLLLLEKKRIEVGERIHRLSDFINIAFQASAYSLLGLNVLNGLLSVGDFTKGVSALINFMAVSMYLTTHILNVNDSSFYLHKYKSFLNTRSKYDDAECQYTLKDFNLNEIEIEFADVSFRYPNSTNYVLKHVNLKIHKGQKLAIVGYNGAGKTTFSLLLTRMFDPTDGEILLNGVDIRKIKYSDYLKLFSTVNQDYSLLAFSLFENISGKNSPNDEEKKRILDLLKANGMGDKLEKMYRGGETPVSKLLEPSGIDFSGGERQNIAISRALYKKAPIILMDEPTSSLDPMAEQRVYQKFAQMSNDSTAVFISHRIYSTRFCDVVAVIEKGEIMEYGTFDELIAQRGVFYGLYKQQADYFTDAMDTTSMKIGDEAYHFNK